MKNKNFAIGLLCVVICIMAVAYAAFATTLNINGTASIASNWSIIIPTADGITCNATAVKGGDTTGLSASGIVNNGTSASFSMAFVQPGDKAECTVKISNTGTLDAKVKSIQISGNDDNGAIRLSVTGIEQGDKLAKSSDTTFKVTGIYDSSIAEDPAEKVKNLTVTIIYEQDM